MINKKVNTIIKIILPVIFIVYASSITFFTHSHIVNGVTIVHSHPFQKSNDGLPSHEHTGAEIQLIHTLSSFSSTGLIVLSVILGLIPVRRIVLQPKIYLFLFESYTGGLSRLRPPPSFIV